MYIKRIPTGDKKDSKVFIAMSVPGSKKRRTVERLGLFSELAKAKGSEEAAEAFVEARRASRSTSTGRSTSPAGRRPTPGTPATSSSRRPTTTWGSRRS